MAVINGRLASQATTTSLVVAYTVPTGKRANIRQIAITNVSGSAVTFRLASLLSGEVAGDVTATDYLQYDTSLAANAALWLTFEGSDGLVLDAGASLAIRGSDTNTNINVFGQEVLL